MWERAPRGAELLSGGVHEATGTFDAGNPDLAAEVAHSVEASIRRAKGPLRFEATAFYTRFSGFIYRNLTGQTCDEDFGGSAAVCTIATVNGSSGSVCCTRSRRTTSPAHETETGGYDLVKAELSYTAKLSGDSTGRSEVRFGVVGDNLLNDDLRFAQSFKKDEVLQPGRTVKLIATVKF